MPYYCLWLLPPEPLFAELKADIRRVVKEFGSGPLFDPHVTLIGGITGMSEGQAIEKMQALKGFGEFDLSFSEVTGADKWNQIAVASAGETKELTELHSIAREVFKGTARGEPVTWPPPLAKPHLSLAYGEDSAVRKVCKSPKSFCCGTVALVDCDPPSLAGVADWKIISRVSLKRELVEPANDGAMEIKVTTKKSSAFYIKSVCSFLRGVDAKPAEVGKDAVEAKPAVKELRISALGDAIAVAVAAASRAEAEGLGSVTRIQTAYPSMEGSMQGCAQMLIDLQKK
eukprot:TRINITY_DN57081_c0_g1_i1.p1 TRINITY_DN57081_c0_g1~~TRINITY_DN57081_c0_g1_i1.p1  ORF type:complete len:286 (-),score=36.16 TRINITY_DN57081_c0_g1_i1:107-964(-)